MGAVMSLRISLPACMWILWIYKAANFYTTRVIFFINYFYVFLICFSDRTGYVHCFLPPDLPFVYFSIQHFCVVFLLKLNLLVYFLILLEEIFRYTWYLCQTESLLVWPYASMFFFFLFLFFSVSSRCMNMHNIAA